VRVYHRIPMEQRLQRLTAINDQGCWVWAGNVNKDGYGLTNYHGKTMAAHRVSYMVRVGEIAKGLSVLHSCDVPACINPSHLHLGTQAQNRRECVERGRNAPQHGEFNPQSRLTEDQASQILELSRSGEKTRLLADKFSVSGATISAIRSGRRWAHLGGAGMAA